jgi:hypothetical protein
VICLWAFAMMVVFFSSFLDCCIINGINTVLMGYSLYYIFI